MRWHFHNWQLIGYIEYYSKHLYDQPQSILIAKYVCRRCNEINIEVMDWKRLK